jgi:hypothetical protein
MNLTSGLLALALLGMDDPQSKPDSTPKVSGATETKVDADKTPETVAADRNRQGVNNLKQATQAGGPNVPPRMTLPKVAKPRTPHDPEPQELWPMTLHTAIQIGLDNSEIVRVLAFGAQAIPVGSFTPTPLNTKPPVRPSDAGPDSIVIARLNADASPERFKFGVMADVRSIEQQYWVLAQAHVQLWAADRAVNLGQEVLKREQAELQLRQGAADVAEAARRLEQFNLDLVSRTSDVITAERQLRNILGLPPADNRRIVPVTPPSEGKFEPDWDACVDEMLEQAPNIVEQKTALRRLRDRIAVASANVAVGPTMTGSGQQRLEATKADPATRQQAARKEIELEGIIREQTRKLAQLCTQIDANYKQFQNAKQLTTAAATRLDAQRGYYEEGRITIDRFLDAVNQHAVAVVAEGQYKATYNTSIVALKEVKGTLLADEGIVVAKLPKPRKAIAARPPKIDGAAQPAKFLPTPVNGAVGTPPTLPMADAPPTPR